MKKRTGVFLITFLFIGAGFLSVINNDSSISAKSSSNGWWNADWQYCKLLTINNAVNDYQMLINVSKNTENEMIIPIPDIVYVDDDYTSSTPGWQYDHFDVIQDGIDAVAFGGTAYVYNGIYYENVIIHKTINLIGEDRDNTIIDSDGIGNVIYSGYSDITIKEFTLQNGSNSAGHSNNCCIELYSMNNTICLRFLW